MQVFGMLLFCLGINKYVVYEDHNELIQIVHEDLIHEVHEITGSICQTEGHYGVLKQSVTGGESGLKDIRVSNLKLMISRPKVNLGENSGSVHLIKQIFNLGKMVLILYGYIIQLAVIHT